jgi:hypothetical protein
MESAMEMKIDAVMLPEQGVLTGGAAAGGVAFWEWRHEDPASPVLSQAIKARLQ